jgi:hypothetical protein
MWKTRGHFWAQIGPFAHILPAKAAYIHCAAMDLLLFRKSYIGVPNTVLAFMVSSVWHNTSSSAAVLQNEAKALSRLEVIASTSPALSAELKSELYAYTSLVQKVEWGVNTT